MLASYAIRIPPRESYTLQPRTLALTTVARTLQQNAVNAHARAASPDASDAYTTFLQQLQRQFQAASASGRSGDDVCEVVALMVAGLVWADETRSIQTDVCVQILEKWVQDTPDGLWDLPPWLTAMLAAHSTAIRTVYVRILCERGFLEPHARDFGVRAATLMLQSEEVESEVESALARVDPLVLQQHFDCI